MRRVIPVLSMLIGFVGASLLTQGCQPCKGYCDGFDGEIARTLYDVSMYDEAAHAHFATELTEAEVSDTEVVLRYVGLDGVAAEVVWEVTKVD